MNQETEQNQPNSESTKRLSFKYFKSVLSTPVAQWGIAVVVFFSIALFYMGSAITSCSTASTAIDSDSTGGLAWSQFASGNKPSWGYSKITNYPVGEYIPKQQDVTSSAVYIPYRLLSSLTTPICGLNLIVLLGYLLSALVMFGLIKWLFGKTSIAYFAGYAVAFVPYHQLKSGSHIFYVYNATFIGIIWAYLWYIQKPSYKRVSLIAVLSAVSMYMDGYFILLTGVLLLSLGLLTILIPKNKNEISPGPKATYLLRAIAGNLRLHARYIVWLVVCLLVFVSPVLIYQKDYGSNIQKSLAIARGDIHEDAKAYGARAVEYVIPGANSYFGPTRYKIWRQVHNHGSNSSEDTLFVGYSVAFLAFLSAVALLRRRKAKVKEDMSYSYLISLFGLTAVICFLFSLTPEVVIAGHVINTPTHYLIQLTSYWRVFARMFLVVDPLLVILASCALYAITLKWSKLWRALLVTLCVGVLFCEYLANPVRTVQDIQKNSPEKYIILSQDKSVDTIAEYPILDQGYAPSVFTYQLVHKKNLINPHSAEIELNAYFQAISGLADAQTLGVLKTLGTKVIVTPNLDVTHVAGLEPYYPDHDNGNRTAYRISSKVEPRETLLTAAEGFNPVRFSGSEVSLRALNKSGTMNIVSTDRSLTKTKDSKFIVEFDAVIQKPSKNKDNISQAVVTQDGKILWKGAITSKTMHISFNASSSSSLTFKTEQTLDISNMQARAGSLGSR